MTNEDVTKKERFASNVHSGGVCEGHADRLVPCILICGAVHSHHKNIDAFTNKTDFALVARVLILKF